MGKVGQWVGSVGGRGDESWVVENSCARQSTFCAKFNQKKLVAQVVSWVGGQCWVNVGVKVWIGDDDDEGQVVGFW